MVQECAAMAVEHLLALILAVEATGAAPASLVVRTGDDVQAPCPAASRLAAALRRRLPALRVAIDAAVGEGDLRVSLRPRGDGWQLRLEGAGGRPMMAREILPADPGCDAVAETAAIMLERYVTAIEWRGQDPRLQPASLAVSGGVGRRPGGGLLTLGAGLAAWTELPGSAVPAPALALDLSLRLGRAVVGVWGAATAVERMAVLAGDENRGALLTRRALLGGSLSDCGTGQSRRRLCVGLLAAAGLIAGRADGSLFARRPTRALVPAGGALVRLHWPLPWGLEIQMDAAALTPLGTAQVAVEGTAAVRRSPRLYGLLAARLAWGTP
jgi:hypothetical protein